MKVRWQLALFFVTALLLVGCLGLTSRDECKTLERAAKIQCLHKAAITGAYLCDSKGDSQCDFAVSTCQEIWYEFSGFADDDIKRKAELAYNTCFFDIAKILKNSHHCDAIDRMDKDLDVQLLGHEVTKDTCIQEADARADVDPGTYFQDHPNSLCAIVFVLPFLLLFTLHKQHP